MTAPDAPCSLPLASVANISKDDPGPVVACNNCGTSDVAVNMVRVESKLFKTVRFYCSHQCLKEFAS